MSSLRPASLIRWPEPRLWGLWACILAGRLLWLGYWGVLLEHDSVAYLDLHVGLYHPPGYNLFAGLLLAVVDHLEVVAVAQAAVYAGAAALLVRRWGLDARWTWTLALALGIEPLSGKLCATLMAETLFLSILMAALACLQPLWREGRKPWVLPTLGVGMLFGAADMVRHAAPAFAVAAGVAWLLYQRPPLRRWGGLALLVIGFQLGVLPLRGYYLLRMDSWDYKPFGKLSAWNATAFLYPGSEAAREHDSPFALSLRQFPPQRFSIAETWHTNHIYHDSSAFQRFTRGRGTQDWLAAADAAGDLARALACEQPLRLLREFHGPNAARPFVKSDTIHADRLPALIDHGLAFQRRPVHHYHAAWAWVCGTMLALWTVLLLWRRREAAPLEVALLIGTWLYWVGVVALTVVFLRFIYLLGPLLLMGLCAAVARERQRTAPQQ